MYELDYKKLSKLGLRCVSLDGDLECSICKILFMPDEFPFPGIGRRHFYDHVNEVIYRIFNMRSFVWVFNPRLQAVTRQA